MMINFTVKSNIKTSNKNKCKVLILGQYQVFGHDDYLRKRPYSQTCTCIADGCVFEIRGVDFEAHIKSISEDTWNEIIKTCIYKESKINKFLREKRIIQKSLFSIKNKEESKTSFADIFSKIPLLPSIKINEFDEDLHTNRSKVEGSVNHEKSHAVSTSHKRMAKISFISHNEK